MICSDEYAIYMKHHTQKSTGVVADRHASVLLAKDAKELEHAYDEWATTYDQDLITICGGGENASASAACKVLIEHVDVTKSGMTLLDFGCGTGCAAVFLKEHGTDTNVQLDGCDLFTVRCEYYDSNEGESHRRQLERMIYEQKWKLVEKTKRDYLPNDDVKAYVFVLRKNI